MQSAAPRRTPLKPSTATRFRDRSASTALVAVSTSFIIVASGVIIGHHHLARSSERATTNQVPLNDPVDLTHYACARGNVICTVSAGWKPTLKNCKPQSTALLASRSVPPDATRSRSFSANGLEWASVVDDEGAARNGSSAPIGLLRRN